MHLKSAVAMLLSLGLISASALAKPSMHDVDVRETVGLLKERIEQLERQLDDQQQRMEQVGNRIKEHDLQLTESSTPKARGGWFNDIEISGLVEIEAAKNFGFEGEEASDIAFATVELGVDARIYDDWVTAHILALHEDDDTEPWEIDEGIVTIGNVNHFPLYLAAGRLYVPFGNFESQMISDPLTLEIAETREAALQGGFETDGFYGSAFTFNGDTTTGVDDEIEHFGVNLGLDMELEKAVFDIGVSYINNIADSDGIQDYLASATGTQKIANNISGGGTYGILHVGSFTAIGEYIRAVDNFDTAELPFNNCGAKPEAWNLEVGYNFTILNKESTLAVGYQGTDEALSLGLPKNRFLTTLSVGIFDKTTLSVEWAHDEDYKSGDSGVDADANSVTGTGNEADTVTAQLAVEF
jgi:hypothetical protein